MNETAQDDRARSTDDAGAVAGIGLVVAALATTSLAVPVRDGVDRLAVVLGLLFAFGTILVFAGRRYGLLERRYSLGGVFCSLLVVLLAGYALTQGASGTTAVPGLEGTVPATFVAFLAAVVSVGIALAEYGSVSVLGLVQRMGLTARLTLLAFVSLVVTGLVYAVFATLTTVAVGELTGVQETAVERLAFAVGTAATAVAYLFLTDRGLSYVDLERPSLRTVGWIAAGIGLIFLANVVISELFLSGGVESSEHSIEQQVRANPTLVYVMIPASILVTGPFEELLYRNVIQKSMSDLFSPLGALLVSSVVFAAFHTSAYSTAGSGALIASLAVVFGLSLVLGTVYLLTENIVVPALVHGVYNAVVFASFVL
ncbi:CPBP family intramembrane glutamic endopeptidase [Natronosalvus halobius]|uniref:CPBP family intramembrane glutamic endopeptidase n=1 Tax=Natronosalvus halobius TaxID=2953746 RepID=UPI00209C97AE|nr:type II CAAX endopeptidase family protein [Natronosalvus halobius]USZ71213.1 CPBP family intramembrane metalloprotease [Natronosalvus halobius]